MRKSETFKTATGANDIVPEAWMSASQVRPFVFEDPGLVWLRYHGASHGLLPEASDHDFLTFISEKARGFEDKWVREVSPEAKRVCGDPTEVRFAEKVRRTISLMHEGVPVIEQGALWWAPERIYGVPDLMVRLSWLRTKFPQAFEGADPNTDHYVIVDLKFSSGLDSPAKVADLRSYETQVRIYSYMLGHLQGLMPQAAYLIGRGRTDRPLAVGIRSRVGAPLDKDLAEIRDRFVDIKMNGAKYLPWKDAIARINLSNEEERWAAAKRKIALEFTPGGDPSLLYRVGPKIRALLAERGYRDLASLVAAADTLPLEGLPGMGSEHAGRVRALLRANRDQKTVLADPSWVPRRARHEFFVDFEYFTNVNVDFDSDWPALRGRPMIFMIGVGWEEKGTWRFRRLAAKAEDPAEELKILDDFVAFLGATTGWPGVLAGDSDEGELALYHWAPAEVVQTADACKRHGLADDHPLRRLPYVDLRRVFLDAPVAIPGMWKFGLKGVAKALAALEPRFDPGWPGDLESGLTAMVMGWRAYSQENPLESAEMRLVTKYLEADCRALWMVLSWLREIASPGGHG